MDLIAFVKLDRWFRNVKEYYKVDEILERHHVAWKAINEDYETETASGRFKVNIMLAVAQDEADRTSERIKAVFEMKRGRGENLGGAMPLGISVVDKHRTANEDAHIVKALFDYYLANHSIRQAVQNSAELFGRRLEYGAIRKMLSNESYVDVGIVDRQSFDRVQELRKQRSPRTARTGKVYLFSGLARCAECGRRMSGCPVTGYSYYRCHDAYNAGLCHNTKNVREEAIEAFLLDRIVAEVGRVQLIEKKQKPVDTAAIKRKMDKLTDLFMDDLITKEKYAADYKDLQTRLNAAQATKCPPDVKVVATALEVYGTLSAQAKRAFWFSVLESVECENGKPVRFTLRN